VFCESLGAAKPDHADRRESLAVAYADLLRDPKQIDDSTFEVLREEFNEQEIVELTCWSLFMIAAQGFGAVMHISPASDDDRTVYSEWRREGETAAAGATS
jgi:alkylhydroperoxidase family enzyme